MPKRKQEKPSLNKDEEEIRKTLKAEGYSLKGGTVDAILKFLDDNDNTDFGENLKDD